jgi:hypothetical protein
MSPRRSDAFGAPQSHVVLGGGALRRSLKAIEFNVLHVEGIASEYENVVSGHAPSGQDSHNLGLNLPPCLGAIQPTREKGVVHRMAMSDVRPHCQANR